MKKLQTILPFSKENKIDLEHSFIDAIQSDGFKRYVEALRIPKEILQKHTSALEDAYQEFHHCEACPGLKECKNQVFGYCPIPRQNGKIISFSYEACPYLLKNLKETKYQKFLSIYDVPEEMRRASLNNIYKDDKCRLPIIKYFKEFMDQYLIGEKPKGMYLYGSFGSGKTYLVAALFNELAKSEVTSVIVYYPELLRGLKSSFETDYEERFQYLKMAPLLLLDDIGAENMTPWSRDEILGTLLQYRMDSKLPTFFTSNLSLTELEEHFSKATTGIDKVKARRVMERIKQLSREFPLISKNRRQ